MRCKEKHSFTCSVNEGGRGGSTAESLPADASAAGRTTCNHTKPLVKSCAPMKRRQFQMMQR